MGWVPACLAAGAPTPVYALGGMSLEDLDAACCHGAHGVALMRGLAMTAKQRKWLALGGALLLLAGVKFGLIYYWYGQRSLVKLQPLACGAGQLSCALPGGGAWRFVSAPVHGKPFEIRLQGVAARDAAGGVQYGRHGHGFQSLHLRARRRRLKATVTLPLCVSGAVTGWRR